MKSVWDKAPTWVDLFSPVAALGRDAREGQAKLGNSIIDVIHNSGSLIAQASTGTGKSFAILIPLIDAVHNAKKKKRPFRGVISTETITLQTQLVEKDLPFLHSLYKGFTYTKLMGRANYVCLNSAKLATRGNSALNSLYEKLELRKANLGNGELSDAERVLGQELTPNEWKFLVGSSKFCADNQCQSEDCFSTKARNEAMRADIVVVNHAILGVDIEMKVSGGGGPFTDGMLGQFEVLCVDEAHKLEDVLVSQWTKTLNDWELQEMTASVIDGVEFGRTLVTDHNIGYTAVDGLDAMQDVLSCTQRFYHQILLRSGEQWKGSESSLSLKYLTGSISPSLSASMTEFEEENPKRLVKAHKALAKCLNYLKLPQEKAMEDKVKGLRKINKAIRACRDLMEFIEIFQKAMETKDGIVQQFGTFGAVVKGWERKNGDKGMTIELTPLDVSGRSKAIWAGVRSKIMMSATLIDLTENSFRYARECVAFPAGKELNVDTPFSLMTQQLVYVTPANQKKVEDGQYSFEELVNLMESSKGRALVLFTSRRELDWAAYELRQLQAQGKFPYKIFVQEQDINKTKLAKEFKEDVNSVLLATRSFFTGFDAPGETVTMVALAKWPLPRYSVTCRQQITHWRSRGFHKWYEMRSLADLQQASGRLVRSAECRGVVAILDFRAYDTTSNVFKIASTGVMALGSPVTHSIEEVQHFLELAA